MTTYDELLAQVPSNPGPQLSVFAGQPPPVPPDVAPPQAAVKFRPARPDVDITTLDPRIVSRANELFDKMPEDLRSQVVISSGMRTRAKQEAAYERYQVGAGGLAAKPGQSQHEDAGTGGRALDFNGTPQAALKWLQTNGPSVGIEFPFGAKGDPAHAQLIEARAGRGGSTTDTPSNESAYERLLAQVPVAGSEESRRAALPSLDTEPTPFSVGQRLRDTGKLMLEDAETAAAVTTGVVKGVLKVPLGIAQAASDVTGVGKDQFIKLQEMYQGLSDQFEEVTGKRPVANFAGELMGATAAILYGARALGPAMAPLMPRAVTGAWEMLGPVGRTTAVGVGLGATPFYEKGVEGEHRLGLERFVSPRVVDAVGGGIFGALGGIVLKGVNFAMTRLAQSGQAEKFLPELEKTAADITRNTERPLAETLSHYANVEKQGAVKYALRTATGRTFEGFPSGVGTAEVGAPAGFDQAIQTALAASPARGIETRRNIQTLGHKVAELLGLNKEKGRLAEWQAQQKTYEEQIAKMGLARQGGFQMQLTPQQLQQAGVTLPPPPTPYVPEPVTAEAYAAARTAINATIRGTRDNAAKTQAKMMLYEIDKVAAEAAKDFGLSGAQFMRQAIAANKFYVENVAPLRQFFGGKMAAEAQGRANVPLEGMTPAQFFDKVVKMIETNDLTLVRDLAKVLGPGAKDNMKMMMTARALEKIDSPQNVSAAVKYIKDHEPVLRELLGRDEYTQLLGLGKIAQSVMKTALTEMGEAKRSYNPWSRSLAPILATYNLFQGQFLQAAGTMAALPAYHAAMRVLSNVHQGRAATPLIRRAAGMDPDSQAFNDLMRVIERRTQASIVVGTEAALQ